MVRWWVGRPSTPPRSLRSARPSPPRGNVEASRGAYSRSMTSESTIPFVPRHVVALVGPTASGKTEVAIALSRRMAIEVISADSRQLREGMAIGTAAPTFDELASVPHHLVH